VTDYWTIDFTMAELKMLKIKQVLVEGRVALLDFLFTFPTLEEVILYII